MRINTINWAIAVILAGCATSPPPQPTEHQGGFTRAECEEQGGVVVGDIGDGAIHRSYFVCPSGRAAFGEVFALEGEPIAIEGEVCCPR